MAFYKQSTAYTRLFKMISSTDHLSLKTAASPVVNLSKAGAAFGAAGGTVTEIANGWYKVALNTTDTNTLGDLAFYITGTGADDTDFVDQVVVRDLADLAFPATSGRSLAVDASGRIDLGLWVGVAPNALNSGNVQADVERWLNGAIPAVNVTGVPKVDVVDWLGSVPDALSSGKVPGDLKLWLASAPNALVQGKLDVASGPIRSGTAQAGAAGTITLDAGASATDNFYRGAMILLVSATGAGQARLCTGYTGSSKVATVAPNWTTNPDATSIFIVMAWSAVDVATWLLSAPSALNSGAVQADVERWVNAVPDVLSSGKVPGDVKLWLTAAPNALNAGLVQADVERWLNGVIPAVNVTGVPKVDLVDWLGSAPDALSSGKLPADVKLWLASAPNVLVSGRVDASVGAMAAAVLTAAAIAADAITAAKIADGAIDRATFALDTGLQSIRAGAAQGGTANTITLDAGASSTSGLYSSNLIVITGGLGAGNVRLITFYDGTTKIATVSPDWVSNVPDATSTFVILNFGRVDLGEWRGVIPNPLVGTRVDANAQVVGDKTGYALTTAEEDAIVNKVWDELTSEARTAGSYGQLVKDDVNASVAAIKAKTDSLTFTGANKVDASVRDWLGTAPNALIGGRVDADLEALNNDTVALQNLAKSASVIYRGSVTGAATTTTLIDSGLTQADTDFWKGRIVIFTSGTLKYQATDVTGFDPALDKLTFTALTQAPAGADTFVVI